MARCRESREGKWCGLCYAGRRGRQGYKGHLGYVKEYSSDRGMSMGLRNRKKERSEKGNDLFGPVPCGLSELYPDLAAFLANAKWGDGASRVPGTIMVFVEGGVYKGWLHDRDACCGAFVTGASLTELLSRCDACISDDSADWREDKKSPVRRG